VRIAESRLVLATRKRPRADSDCKAATNQRIAWQQCNMAFS